ncbi:MAG: N-acetylmuramoyl-L-alanine amidase [Chloroflexota bacterium]|nr:N-acetylmuramoyl-L-alanine amidase [Chloroflexota bacterium]
MSSEDSATKPTDASGGKVVAIKNVAFRSPLWWAMLLSALSAGALLIAGAALIRPPVPGSTASAALVTAMQTVQPEGTAGRSGAAVARGPNIALFTRGPVEEPTQRSQTIAISPSPTPKMSRPLAGRRIGIDPGHGPRDDLGAVVLDPNSGKLILSEAEFNLDVSLRVRDILRARGASVVLTRESADTFTAPWPADANGDGVVGGPKDDLQERVDIVNAFHAEVFLSIHANSVPHEKEARGLQVFYCSTSDCAFPEQSKRLGQLVLDRLAAKLAAAGYQVEAQTLHSDLWLDTRHIFVLGPVNPPAHVRAANMPGVLAESLYLSSSSGAVQLKKDDVRQAIALGYAEALQAYLLGDTGGR